MRTKHVLVTLLAVVLLAVGGAYTARWTLRRQVMVGQSSTPADRLPVTAIDHAAWDALLHRYVDDQGLVDYAAWQASPDDKRALEKYLSSLSRADTSSEWPREAELAYWINAYNALTIYGILREYPTTSIRNFTPRFWGYHIWHDLLLPVGDETVSLDEIEHGRLRPLGDYRIHFALVCASRGCPALLNKAYTAELLDEQLEAQSRRFMNDPRNFRRVEEEKRTYVEWSPLLAWYDKDFGPDRATRMHRLAKWVTDEETRRAALDPDTYVRSTEYDWGLNDQSTARAPHPTESVRSEMPPAEESTEASTAPPQAAP